VEGLRVGADDLEPPRISPCDHFQGGNRAPVMLDGDDVRSTQRKQRAGQPARTRADLDDGRAFQRSRRARDAGGEVEIEQEILTERFARRQRMLANDLAQRRQVVDRAHAACAAAMRSANRNAAMRLAGLARPLPAMSNAVPWSGEVRMKG